ncbi:hypothetical protein [Streptomyces noursei]|uniref:hypothetical protein n=1 Tax=Streptomyces noursei TaxID=1971 RepID=UPI00196415FB|nr:hypothetical protein [Streptomyces noursei]QRX89962.1 hypothetical protein JNO44_02995 [Streptomyces noursei]
MDQYRTMPPNVALAHLRGGLPDPQPYTCNNGYLPAGSYVTEFTCKFKVPPTPKVVDHQTVFVWPALFPSYLLQPVLGFQPDGGWFLWTYVIDTLTGDHHTEKKFGFAPGDEVSSYITLVEREPKKYTYVLGFDGHEETKLLADVQEPSTDITLCIEGWKVGETSPDKVDKLPPEDYWTVSDIKVVSSKGIPDSLDWVRPYPGSKIIDTSAQHGCVATPYRV